MSNIVAIVGRPNVGKSTLFNRLTESRKAIVDEESGVTRDRHYGKADWNGRFFSVIDTGGYIHKSDDIFEKEIQRQVELAVDESDIILFAVDVKDGLTDLDKDVAKLLRRQNKPVMVVANKADNAMRQNETGEFYALGFGDIYGVSAINGSGTGELLDALVEKFVKPDVEELNIPKLAIIGQPNVGKSSLLNALIGEERTIVTPIAGTTRDTIYTHYNSFGFDFLLIDTAGLRKKRNVKEDIEFYSVMRSIRAIEESDVCLLMIDAVNGISGQDINIFHLLEKNHKGAVIVVNKWDLIEKDTHSTKKMEATIREKLAPFEDVPIVFTSVTTKQRIHKALEVAIKVYTNKMQRISTSKLNKIMLPYVESHPPPALKGKNINIKYITQLPGYSPVFAFFCNHPQYIKESYRRYLENKMRENFDFSGVPITIYFRPKDKNAEDED
jgi:GTP-binding protein